MKFYHEWKEFVQAELRSGGPEPSLKMIQDISGKSSPVEKVWLMGCYASHHAVSSAVILWKHFRPEYVLDRPQVLWTFLEQHWDGLPVRDEMRSHRMIEKRHQCLTDFARYALDEEWSVPDLGYEFIYKSSMSKVKYYGRYMAIKYMEMLRMCVRPELILLDIRAKTAWSPRIALGLFFPENHDVLTDRSNNSDTVVEIAESCARTVRELLRKDDVIISNFQLQLMLCTFKQYLNGTGYTCKAHDEELEFLHITEKQFGESIPEVWDTRKALFLPEYLGEFGGWTGVRKDQHVKKGSFH